MPASNYADAFGVQWNTFRKTQLDSFTGTNISRDRLKRCLGEELWRSLEGAAPVSVLEAGCGAGRFTEVLLSGAAVYLTSIDLSSAVEANQANCPQSERHQIIQCDITQLPFEAGEFDLVICLGVVQHIPSPETAITKLFAQVKPGGWFVFDHYTPNLKRFTKVSTLLLRPFLKRMSPARGIKVTAWLTRIFFPLHRAVRGSRAAQAVLSRFSPLLTYFHAYPELNDQLQYEWALLDTHDSLTDYYKHLRTAAQLQNTLAQLGAVDVSTTYLGDNVEVRCRKASPR